MKIFGIGLSKTGTTSLTSALLTLGFSCEHYFFDLDRMKHLDAGTDLPIAHAFRELDVAWPGSKFILTVRDLDAWLGSCATHFHLPLAAERELPRKLRTDVFGVETFDEAAFLKAYARHLQAVMCHFRERPADLLVMDICAGDGWNPLCRFLGIEQIPTARFPHDNRTAEKVAAA